MIRRPPRSTRTDTRFPNRTLFRSAFDEPAGPIILGACVVSGRRDLPAGERLAARRDPALGHWLVTPSDRRRRSGERIFARKVRILTGSPSCPYRGVSPDRNVKP